MTAFLLYCLRDNPHSIRRRRNAPRTIKVEATSKIGFTAFRLSHLSQNPEGAWASLIDRSDYGFHALDYSAIKSVNL
jgi:hypothetical protein